MSSEKFTELDRLRKSREFSHAIKHGDGIRSGPVRIVFLRSARQRLGVSISRRVGGAVVRNRIKRVIREFFRQNRECFPVGDCVVIIRNGGAGLTNERLRGHLRAAIGRMLDAG